MIMRKGLRWLSVIIVVLLTYKFAIWTYEKIQSERSGSQQQQVLDIDKRCKIVADTNQCICRHRRTNKILSVPYSECRTLAR